VVIPVDLHVLLILDQVMTMGWPAFAALAATNAQALPTKLH